MPIIKNKKFNLLFILNNYTNLYDFIINLE